MTPLIYADFQNADRAGRVRLNTAGTQHDLSVRGVTLSEGLALTLYTDDGDVADGLRLDGVAEYSPEEKCWVAVVDWAALRTTSRSSQPSAAAQG